MYVPRRLLQALKDREEAVRTGRLTTIIFIRDRNGRGQEVGGPCTADSGDNCIWSRALMSAKDLVLRSSCIAPVPASLLRADEQQSPLFADRQVSGYIDYGHRLKTENMEPYFERKKRLMPKPSDLSFYNWNTHTSTSNATSFFQVGTPARALAPLYLWLPVLASHAAHHSTARAPLGCATNAGCKVVCRACCNACAPQVIPDHRYGLLFKNKKDRKVINVDPKCPPGDNSTRTQLDCDDYMHVVLYDHVTRRRG